MDDEIKIHHAMEVSLPYVPQMCVSSHYTWWTGKFEEDSNCSFYYANSWSLRWPPSSSSSDRQLAEEHVKKLLCKACLLYMRLLQPYLMPQYQYQPLSLNHDHFPFMIEIAILTCRPPNRATNNPSSSFVHVNLFCLAKAYNGWSIAMTGSSGYIKCFFGNNS